MDTLTALRTRRAVRKYMDDPVNPEDLETILDCGRYAPCGINRQGWRFIVVTDPAVRERIYEANKRFCILGEDYISASRFRKSCIPRCTISIGRRVFMSSTMTDSTPESPDQNMRRRSGRGCCCSNRSISC